MQKLCKIDKQVRGLDAKGVQKKVGTLYDMEWMKNSSGYSAPLLWEVRMRSDETSGACGNEFVRMLDRKDGGPNPVNGNDPLFAMQRGDHLLFFNGQYHINAAIMTYWRTNDNFCIY